MNNGENPIRVGIVIPTYNRPEFLIRQLDYYAHLNSPHPVYIGDASDDKNSLILQEAIKTIGKKISIFYRKYSRSEYTLAECQLDLYNRVKEKYVVFIGDDDYQIPDSLIKCAQFLEDNPDYSSVSGHSVSFRLENNGVYGQLKRLADYPRKQIEHQFARDRLCFFMANYFVPLFSVHRTPEMKFCWSQTAKLKEWSFSTEILPCAISLILGKSKIIDCLSFIRQIHDSNYKLPDIYDWITGITWREDVKTLSDILTEAIMEKDKIDTTKAKISVKKSVWLYLRRQFNRNFDNTFPENEKTDTPVPKTFKNKLGIKFPWLKRSYRRWIYPLLGLPRQIHYEVLQKESKFSNDFSTVLDSFSGKFHK